MVQERLRQEITANRKLYFVIAEFSSAAGSHRFDGVERSVGLDARPRQTALVQQNTRHNMPGNLDRHHGGDDVAVQSRAAQYRELAGSKEWYSLWKARVFAERGGFSGNWSTTATLLQHGNFTAGR